MDPQFTDIRMAESAKVWIIDTRELRWRALENIQDTSRKRVRQKLGKRKFDAECYPREGPSGLRLGGGGEDKDFAVGIGHTLL